MILYDWLYLDYMSLPRNEDSYDYVFTGSVCDLDERTIWVGQYCNDIAKKRVVTKYERDSSTNMYLIDGHAVDILSLGLLANTKILIEATSLDFPDLLLLIHQMKELNVSFDISYVEPTKYANFASNDDEHSSYVISGDGLGLEFIPQFTCPSMPDRTLIVALGFEGHRFGGVIESEEFVISKAYALGGVPAFNAGMEKKSFKANYKQLNDSNATVKIAAANDPFENYRVLDKLKDAIRSNFSRILRPIVLAPFGTKPTSISMICFAINNESVGVIYDFAKRRKGRTCGIGKAHIWSFGIH